MTGWLRAVLVRLRAITRRECVERELDEEMADHLESETEELISRGLPAAEANSRARETMGRMAAIRDECRDARGVNWWEDLRRDAGFALRLLTRRKTFSVTVMVTMALGIGSTSAVFSVVDSVLLRPLPYPEPQRLISVDGLGMRGPFEILRAGSKAADYAAWEGGREFNLSSADLTLPERVKGSQVSANLFDVIGTPPVAGRTFRPGEEAAGRNRVAVLSYRFWMERYGGRADAVGRQIVLDEVAYEITGVMGTGFSFPSPEVMFWTPMRLDSRAVGEYWGQGGTQIIGRLRPGATMAGARAEAAAQVPRIRSLFPWRMPDAWGTALSVRGLKEALVAGVRLRSWLLLGAVGLVLLIGVVNVANLMIGQTTARAHELSLRTMLGAGPTRMARQMLTEAVVLTGAGGVLGVALGYLELAVLRRLLPADMPRLAEVTMDARILAFAAAISVGSGLLAGLWPAWRSRPRATAQGGRWATTGRSSVRIDALLVMTEAAFATVLLVGSFLVLRSFWTMLQVDPGFQVASVVTAELSPSPSVAGEAARREALWHEVRSRLQRYPGVREVAAMNVLPLTPQITTFPAAIEGHPVPAGQPQHMLWSTSVTPEHREVLGIRLIEGRGFANSDRAGSESVALVSRATARRYWPGQSAIGRRLKPVYAPEWRTIVGVLDDVRTFGITGLPDWVHGEVYMPMAQSALGAAPVNLLVRAEGDSSGFAKALPGLVHEVCPTCAVSKIARMERVVARAVETPRSTAWLVGGFALLALGMAAAGIYGVVNHGVVRRTKELGVRMALGAGRGHVAALVLGSSIRSVAVGIGVGLVASWAMSRLIRSLLYGVGEHDLLSYLAGSLLLLAVAVAASATPVIRAIRIDPAVSLREG